ncbi:MAG: ComEC/Rec2 family competence protein, partial [Sciscionella sp.]
TVFGVLAAAIAPLWLPAAQVVVHLAGPELRWLIEIAHRGARVPAAALPWPSGAGGALLLALILMTLVVLLRLRRTRVVVLAVVLGFVVVIVPVRIISPGWPPPGWAMVDCDVGQGDAETLETGHPGEVVLVDTGPDGNAILDCLSRLGVRSIALIALSHLHADHVGGLGAVLAHYPVGAVAVGDSREPGWAWRQVRRQAAAAHCPLLQLGLGMRLTWAGLALDVIGPRPGDQRVHGGADSGTAINNTSVVLRAHTSVGTVLLTGDVELESQDDLLGAHTDLRATVLKIPHHGSRYSDPAFLDAVHARVAVASDGKGNPYGHPSAVTLNRLRADGALVLRTDLDGDVAITGTPDDPTVVRRGSPRPAPH